jgi:mono/diheme cytochrome c family protein
MRIVLAFALVALAGCSEKPFHQPLKLGGKLVSAETLNRGYAGYELYCRPCHGERGDGHGYSAISLRPPPRDFTQGLFKFGHVVAPALPPDPELVAIVRLGLHGTAMLPWDIPDAELLPIVQYLKIFSPKWANEVPGRAIEATPDPFGAAREAEAVTLGEKVYHGEARCSSCHPAYVTHEKLYEITRAFSGSGQTEFSPEMYHSQPKESEYCLEWKPGWKTLEDRECAKPVRVIPPNFLHDPLRTVHPGTELVDLYRIIASGIEGANMPTWKGGLPEEDLWALAYYVRSLMRLRGRPEAARLEAELASPQNLDWKPPR